MINAWNAALYDLHIKHYGLTNVLNLCSVIPNYFDKLDKFYSRLSELQILSIEIF